MSETVKDIRSEDAARLYALRQAVVKAYMGWGEAKAKAKEANGAYEGALADLNEFIDELRSPQQRLPLDDPDAPAGAATDAPAEEADEPGPAATIAPAPGDDSWRDDSLAKLDLGPKLLDHLNDADLFTVGQLADWSTAGRLLTDIGGIGAAKAAKIEDALIAYWRRRKIDDAMIDPGRRRQQSPPAPGVAQDPPAPDPGPDTPPPTGGSTGDTPEALPGAGG